MKLHELTKITTRPKKKLGRGIGSGKGKTAGRGTKGQKARGKIPLSFTGGLPLYKKLPFKKGKGNPKLTTKKTLLDIVKLDIFKDKTIVDLEKLIKTNIISEKQARKGVKILNKGKLSRALTVRLPVSASARKKIEESGGKVEYD
ncbi:50S ribosomal protein L15 [Patescibacteria group bacterium]|nr:50S ribosomal protein L15 [Patescibacteria group bacterium]